MEISPQWPLYHVNVFVILLCGCMMFGWYEGTQLAKLLSAKDTTVSTTTSNETRVSLPKAEAALLKRPTVAYPTILLLLVSNSSYYWCTYSFIMGNMTWYTTIILNTISVYWSFTVAHDAVHGAIVPRNSTLNDLFGHIATIPLLGPFVVVKTIHLTHHKYSGDHNSAPDGSSLDPDSWAAEGPQFFLPFRWATVFLHYSRCFTKFMSWRRNSGIIMKSDIKGLYTLSFAIVFLGCCGNYCHYHIHPTAFSVCILIPQFIGVAWLMYFFDYIPHRPNLIPYRQDPYRSTNATSFMGSIDNYIWCFFCMNQNIHIIHHIWPSVPFYKYRALWTKYGTQLVENGVRVVPLYIENQEKRVSIFPELLAENNIKKKKI